MMRVLLISSNMEEINMPALPLGMAYVAAAVRNAGHLVKSVNLMAHTDISAILKEVSKGFSPELIGLSVRNIDDQTMEPPTFLLPPVKKVVDHLRGLSSAPIVLGGAGYSIFPKSVLKWLGADMGIQGEGEAPFTLLLSRLEGKRDLSEIPGLWLPESGLQRKPEFTRRLDEFQIPVPNLDLELSDALTAKKTWIPFQTRRGCPMNCNFCSTATIEGRIMRKHSAKKVIKGIAGFVDEGFNHLFFVDNTFNFPPSYAESLCEAIIANNLSIRWQCILYPHKVKEKLIQKMAEAGCREVALGFESGSTKILKIMNKRYDPEEVFRISGLLEKYNIRRQGFLLLGGPGETRDSVEQSLCFADRLDLEALKITMGIRIYPHTGLCRQAMGEGMLASHEERLFPRFYMVRGLEGWMRQTVGRWAAERPRWITDYNLMDHEELPFP